ncbi:Serine/threonine-protein kinase ATG1 [Triticum urartu]|uniref:Serine/threonine-protein kinase ATG1 n=1 Tax=Triticum urartu TaxID=4572 RepID=M7ZEM5_TRIUA|nr:Serine/threonine-protein kinase ATG1 [Triticum urartu]
MDRLSAKLRDSLLSEVDILRRITHPNIIALHDSIRDGGRIYLILEYCRGGDLYAYLLRHKRVPETCGLQKLRESNVVHRDLKPQNILLVSNNGTSILKIADFGFAKFLQPSGLAETLCGSPLYMAPEVMQAQKYDAKLMKNILKSGQLRFPSDCELSHDCIDLCRKLLRISSVERLTVEEFVNHPFLSEHAPERILSALAVGHHQTQEMAFPSLKAVQRGFRAKVLKKIEESPAPESNAPMKSYGFATSKKLDKTSGQSPSKHTGLFSRYIMGNNYAPSSQRLDHPGQRTKESKIGEGRGAKGVHPEDSPIIDSLEFVDQEYVFVSGHAEGSSSSTSASLQRNLPAKYENPSVSPPNLAALSAPVPINGTAINRQQSAGTGSLDSHCSPISGTSHGSAYMSDGLDQPPSDYLTRIRLLGQYASTIVELVKEEIKGGRHLEAFSIQLIILATWKQAIHICNSYAASAARESPLHDITMKGLDTDAPHLLANSQMADEECTQIERQFLTEVEHAEELASTVGQIPDATAMPDAVELIFQYALEYGRHGGVVEMMGKAAVAMSRYTKAICLLRFLLMEAPSLALNPPLSLTRSDRHRLRSYIEALNARLSQLQCPSH